LHAFPRGGQVGGPSPAGILGPKRGFKTPVSAYRTLKGMEAMHALRKGQGRSLAYGRSNPMLWSWRRHLATPEHSRRLV